MRQKVIRAGMTRKQLADIYKVNIKIMRTWLHDLGITHHKSLKPMEIAYCVASWGIPGPGVKVEIPMNQIPDRYLHPIDRMNLKAIQDEQETS